MERDIDLMFDSLMDAIHSSDESDIFFCTKSIVEELGGKWFVFASLHPRDQSPDRITHRFLIGCLPSWCQAYNANMWYLNDPYLEYARTNTAPILGRDMKPQTRGQREMLEAASENGFRSTYVIPQHGSEKGRMGLLYIGSDEPAEIGEPKLAKERKNFRSLAGELLDWSSACIKNETIARYGFSVDEIKVLEYVKNGFGAGDIARDLGKSVWFVYDVFRGINKKIGVKHISSAVQFAGEHGFWG
jgi:DNA-binding CsgD family transcriptional regulator